LDSQLVAFLFGIQVCQGFSQYYTPWEDATDDVSRMCSTSERVVAILQQLKAHFEGRGLTPAETEARVCIDACMSSIQDLQEALQEVMKVQLPINGYEFKGDKWRFLYPFRKETGKI
jgi:hypothetical protein